MFKFLAIATACSTAAAHVEHARRSPTGGERGPAQFCVPDRGRGACPSDVRPPRQGAQPRSCQGDGSSSVHPGSKFYGEYLGPEALAALTEPEPAHAEAVRAWANQASGSTVKEIQGRRFEVTMPRSTLRPC